MGMIDYGVRYFYFDNNEECGSVVFNGIVGSVQGVLGSLFIFGLSYAILLLLRTVKKVF